jgi:serine/threonine-protein kinase RsbT
MAITRHNTLDIIDEQDISLTIAQCRILLEEMKFSEREQVRLSTAVSELARNVIKYADQGVCNFHSYMDRNKCRLRIIIEDSGPGIPDIDKAMEPGYSTSGTLGIGLSGVKNLVDDFRISSSPSGTRVEIAISGATRP